MRPADDWTAQHIPELSGRSVLVTGGNSGVGFETARHLVGRGARVILACRNAARGRDAQARLRARTPAARVELLEVDLSDLASVRGAAGRWRQDNDRLDALVNNAGVMATPLRRTADGFELQFGTNHLGHFALTGLLLDTLLATDRPRVVTVSSNAHQMASVPLDDVNWNHRRYRPWRAYAQSKLANLLFTFELQRRVVAARLPLAALGAHPGYAATRLQTRGPLMRGANLTARLSTLANRLFAQDAAAGALPIVAAVALPEAQGAEYWGPDGRRALRGLPTRLPVSTAATDMTAAALLWEQSERLTGVIFDALAPPAA